MFSYLRPTGRRVPSSHGDQGHSNEGNIEDLRDNSLSPQSSSDDDVLYHPIVSPTAPVLPPIPRVASVYGAPANLPSFDQKNEHPRSEKLTRNEQKKESELAVATFGRTSRSRSTESTADGVQLRSRTSSNFSRPFKPIPGPVQTSASQFGPPMQSSEPAPHEYSAPRAITTAHHDKSQGEPKALHRPQSHEDKLLQVGMRPSSRARSDVMKEQLHEPYNVKARDPINTTLPARQTAMSSDNRSNSPQPRLQRAAQSSPQITNVTAQAPPQASSSANPGRSILPLRKSLQNMQNEFGAQTQIPPPQQRQPPSIVLSNNSNTHHRSGKPMLTRLNPMSLWARRRSTQPTSEVDNDPHKRNLTIGNNLPDDYDPRIRGNKVHDFSAPRLRQPLSPLEIASTASGRSSGIASPGHQADISSEVHTVDNASRQRRESERQHTPVFKEHFGDEIDTWRFDKNDRRNQNTTGILERMSIQESEKHPTPLPPFAQKFPEHVHDPLLLSDPTFAVAPRPPSEQTQNTSNRSSATALVPPRESSPRTSTSKSPSRSRSRTPSIQDPAASTDIPKHLQSNASRFSFDLAGVGSAVQEKLLEDKHRQKVAQKARMSRASQLSAAATDEDFDEDDIDFEAGIEEEEIPGVNVDDDEYPVSESVAKFTLGQTTGQLYTHANVNLGSNIPTLQPPGANNTLFELEGSLPRNGARDEDSDDDDLYFDDGMIEDVVTQDGDKFDESVFDDETSRVYGRPLRDLTPEPRPEPEPEPVREPLSTVQEAESGEDSSPQSTRPISLESSLAAGQNPSATTDTSRTSVQPPDKTFAGRRGSTLKQDVTLPNLDQTGGLTKDNLAAYHDALALATHKAAQEGRFDRKTSVDESRSYDTVSDGTTHVTFGDNLPMRSTEPFGVGMDDGAGLDDYEQDEDDIVAAANAEALENDDEGFYGREFGFYANANGSTEAQFANGGYFGPAGMNDIKRSHSGRVNGQEPSLTPITERSEWSQRNSTISLAVHSGHGSFAAPLQTPGLAQIADSIQHEDDSNMSLSALMKLRQNAWGSSSTSLQSNGGSIRSSSPPKMNPAMSPPPRPGIQAIQPHPQQESKHRPNPLKLETGDVMMSPIFPPSRSSGSEPPLSPIRRHVVKGQSSPAKGHSRNSSGAESVTYIKEKDEEGVRWVMERRRTGEGGQVEVLGRQVVEGGRI